MGSTNLWSDIATLVGEIAASAGRHPVAIVQVGVVASAAQFLVAHTLGGYHDGLVKRAERWLRGGDPVAGLGTFQGRVVPMRDEDRAGEPSQRPVIEVVRTQRHTGGDAWRDVHLTVHAEPFRLELPADRDIDVHPSEPLLSGFEETSLLAGRAMREVRSAVYPDEHVWVTGYLEPAERAVGAYRGGARRRTLRAPRGGKVWVTRQAPAEEWRKLARAHRRGGWAALVAIGAALLVAYKGTVSLWLSYGLDAAATMSPGVVLAWAAAAVIAITVWARGYRSARREWNRRFPWL